VIERTRWEPEDAPKAIYVMKMDSIPNEKTGVEKKPDYSIRVNKKEKGFPSRCTIKGKELKNAKYNAATA